MTRLFIASHGGSPLQGWGMWAPTPGALPQAEMMPGLWPFENRTSPLAKQRRIVAKVEQLMALVDALEQQFAASRATAANLLAALVAELTTGVAATVPSANGAPPSQPGATPQVKDRKHHKG